MLMSITWQESDIFSPDHRDLLGAPLLVVANKHDQQGVAQPSTIAERLDVSALSADRPCQVLAVRSQRLHVLHLCRQTRRVHDQLIMIIHIAFAVCCPRRRMR